MELFNLLAKLTLDTNDFDKGIDQAEKDLNGIDISDPKLGLDNDEFNQNIQESQGLGDTFGTDMEKVFNGIKTALAVTGIAATIGGIVQGLKQAVEMTAETADGIDKGSKKLGISTKTYQEWDHALKQSGSSIDIVKKGIMQFQAAIKSADPATPFADAEDQVDGLADKTAGLSEDAYNALRDLGLLSRLQAGEFSNAEEMMNAALLKLAEFDATDDAQRNERGILTRMLFGKGGDELAPLLDEGVEGVKALLSEASDLGLIMDETEIKNAVAYGDAVANLNAELDAIKSAFVTDIIPVLTEAVSWLTSFLTKLNPRTKTNTVFDLFDDINSKSLAATVKVEEAQTTAKKLIEDLQSMGDYWTLDEEGRMTWDALADKALELFPQLSDYIDKDGKKIQGNTKDILANIDAWALLEKQRILSNAMDEKQKAVADQLTEAYGKGAEARAKEAEAEGKKLQAYKEIDAFLNKSGNEGYRKNLEANFGYNGQMTDEIYEQVAGSVNAWMGGRGNAAFDEWRATEKAAEDLRAEAEKLKEEANKAQDSLADEQRYLMEEMGFTEEQIAETEKRVEEYRKALEEIPSDVYTTVHLEEEKADGSHAIGGVIPYDNYHAILHRGERVLTATENRRGSESVDFTAMEDKIIAAIRSGMEGATVRSYLNGKDITAEVSRENMQQVKARRFR